jgi:DNA-binding transcriptional LysR family regulator
MIMFDAYEDVAGVEVRRLRYFVAIAEELHFGRASERLHVAQPALSRQMVELERAIDATLFDRTRNQIKLTAAGVALLPRARDILTRIGEAARVARLAGKGKTGVLNVGFVGSATYSVLPHLLNGFRRANPDVELLLHAMNTADLRVALIDRRIDAAFARPGIDDPEIVDEPLLHEELIVALPEDDALAQGEAVALPDLASRPFVLYPHAPRPSFADAIVGLCRQAGFSPVVAQETMDLQTALGLIAAGAGVSLVPASVADSHRLGILYRPIAPPTPTTTLSLCYRRDNRVAVLATFRATVKLLIAEHRADHRKEDR